MMRNWGDVFRNLPEDQDGILEEVAQRLVREGMGTAAILLLESTKPIGFLTGQATIFATPLLGGFIDPTRLEQFANLLSDRQFVERLIQRIEELENERAGKHVPKGEPEAG